MTICLSSAARIRSILIVSRWPLAVGPPMNASATGKGWNLFRFSLVDISAAVIA